jgi:glycosyltransferase involved in cell wall biosynthesis
MPVPFDEGLTLALVLPAHNEAAHIAGVIASLPAWVDRVIVVDDASTDATAAAVAAVADSRIRVVSHERNRGVGAAMRTGYRAALEEGFDLVGKMDADGQMLATELALLVEPFALGLAEYTKGNRFYFPGGTAGMPAHRGLGNTALTFMSKVASGYWHVYDSQCGFTVIRAAFLRLIDLERLPDGYFFENAMLIRLNALGARVVDVPVSTIYGDETSGVRIGRVLVGFPPRLIAGGARRFWRKHLVTDFGPIGGLTIGGLAASLFGAAFGGYHWWRSIQSGIPATTGTVMIAVLPLMLGIQLLIQAFALSVSASPGAAETAAYVRTLIARGTFEQRR